MDGNPYPPLLRAPNHGGPGGTIPWRPIKKLPRVHPGRPTPPHHFQYGGGLIDQALGGYGDRGGGITGRIWESVLPAISIVICGK